MERMHTADDLRPGWLLVATPALGDPNFRRTVVYMLASDEEGAVGVVLNRRSETAVRTVLPGWSRYVSKPAAVYIGGPVETSAAMCVGVVRTGVDPSAQDGLRQVNGPVVMVDLDADPREVSMLLSGSRLFVGHAGWDGQQLRDEIADGAWDVVPGLATDVLAGPRTDLWFRVLRRQPLPLALRAYHPGDVRRN